MTLTEKIEAAKYPVDHPNYSASFNIGINVAIDIILEHQKGKLELVEITKEEFLKDKQVREIHFAFTIGNLLSLPATGKFYRLPQAKEEK